MDEMEILPSLTGGEGVVVSGQTLQKIQTQFATAVAIQRPRRRLEVIKACEEEATIAGDEFYYSWTVKSKEGPKLVEGLSVQAALAAARNWGNCAVPCSVEENLNTYVFTATFVDLETGFNLQRAFRQKKSLNIGTKYDERAEDIVFQIGQSKAIRNVILNALPSWLTTKMLAKAKENVIEKINKMGIAVAREKTVAFFAKYDITPDRIESKLGGKKYAAWDAEDLALLQGAMQTLLTGQESADSLFPVHQETASKAKDVKARFEEKGQSTSSGPTGSPHILDQYQGKAQEPPCTPYPTLATTNDGSDVFDPRNYAEEIRTCGSIAEAEGIFEAFCKTKPDKEEKENVTKTFQAVLAKFQKEATKRN